MKNLLVICLAIGLLGIRVYAKEGQNIIIINDGFQENEYVNNSHENREEASLMVLNKESNLPVCRFSDRLRINSEFIPEDRIGNVNATSIEDIRICQEEDVWNTEEEEILIGMAVGIPQLSGTMFIKVAVVSSIVGCVLGVVGEAFELRPNHYQYYYSNRRNSILSFNTWSTILGSTAGIFSVPSFFKMPSTFSITSALLIVSVGSTLASREICFSADLFDF